MAMAESERCAKRDDNSEHRQNTTLHSEASSGVGLILLQPSLHAMPGASHGEHTPGIGEPRKAGERIRAAGPYDL